MPQTIRFHLDEDVDPAIAEGLRRWGIDVTTSQEVGLLGALDPIQLAHATAESRVLFTHDDDHLALHAEGVEHAGIAYCHRLKTEYRRDRRCPHAHLAGARTPRDGEPRRIRLTVAVS